MKSGGYNLWPPYHELRLPEGLIMNTTVFRRLSSPSQMGRPRLTPGDGQWWERFSPHLSLQYQQFLCVSDSNGCHAG